MDIVKRAYLKTKEEWGDGSPDVNAFHQDVIEEMKRLIRLSAYGGNDWPSREFGPLPDELRKGRRKVHGSRLLPDPCTPEHPCCDRRGEYNGYASGPLKFVCPKRCSCHD